MLYPGSRFRMADEMLESYIRQLIEGHQAPEVIVAWQGGEPTLMGLDFFAPVDRISAEVPQTRDDRPEHDPDQRHADQR